MSSPLTEYGSHATPSAKRTAEWPSLKHAALETALAPESCSSSSSDSSEAPLPRAASNSRRTRRDGELHSPSSSHQKDRRDRRDRHRHDRRHSPKRHHHERDLERHGRHRTERHYNLHRHEHGRQPREVRHHIQDVNLAFPERHRGGQERRTAFENPGSAHSDGTRQVKRKYTGVKDTRSRQFCELYVSKVDLYHTHISVCWFLLALMCIYPATFLMSATSNIYCSVPGQSYEAKMKLQELFGEPSERDVILVQANVDLLSSGLMEKVTELVRDKVRRYGSVLGYGSRELEGLGLGELLITKDNRSAVLLLSRSSSSGFSQREIGQLELAITDNVQKTFRDLSYVGVAGVAPFAAEGASRSSYDMESMSLVLLPLSFASLALALRSIRLMVIPLCCLVCSTSLCFAFMYLLADSFLAVSSIVPSVMAVISLALTFDYSLFLLSRLQEEVHVAESMSQALVTALQHSGTVVLGSGVTLCYCVSVILLVPLPALVSIVPGAIIAIVMALSVNLVLCPALLLSFSHFFIAAPNSFAPVGSEECSLTVAEEPSGVWCWWSRCITSPVAQVVVLTLLVGVGAVASPPLRAMQLSDDIFLMAARTSEVLKTVTELGTDFSRGYVGPATVVVLPRHTTLYEGGVWEEAQVLLREMALHSGALISAMYINSEGTGEFFPSANEAMLVDTASPMYVDPGSLPPAVSTKAKQLQYVLNVTVAPGGIGAIAMLTPNVTSSSSQAVAWTQRLRGFILARNANATSNVELMMTSQTAEMMDQHAVLLLHTPAFVCGTLLGCTAIVGMMFQSIVMALRSLVTIAFTLFVVFAFAGGVYQFGWLGVAGEGLFFMVPASTFPVVVGLSLDYDIFLMGRIAEVRSSGVSTLRSIQMGLEQTGPTITYAGFIMALAFGGLWGSQVPSLNQISLILTTAVLLDTLVVRTVVTPAIMALLGESLWWPRCGIQTSDVERCRAQR